MEGNYSTILWWFFPYIHMNQPWVHMCPPSWTPLPPPSPSHPSGSSQCSGPEHPVSCIEPGLAIYFTYGNIHVSVLFSHPTPVLLPGKSHGRRSLVGYSPWGRTESDMTEQLHFHALEKEMATHSSVLAWRIPGTGEPGGLPSLGSHRVGHGWSDLAAAVAVLFSQIIPPLPSLTESKSLFFTSVLLLSCIQGHCYLLSKFHIFVLIYCIGVFISDLLHSV